MTHALFHIWPQFLMLIIQKLNLNLLVANLEEAKKTIAKHPRMYLPSSIVELTQVNDMYDNWNTVQTVWRLSGAVSNIYCFYKGAYNSTPNKNLNTLQTVFI